jgi:DNA-binding GntR family transcriptional regulator
MIRGSGQSVIANRKQKAYSHVRAAIFDGRIRPGERISEVQLAKDIGISRTPVREAVHMLASEGLVELLPGYGAYVPLPNADDLRQLFGLREALECYVVQEAAARIEPYQLAAMEDCCRKQFDGIRRYKASAGAQLDEATDLQIATADLTFHRILFEACANRWVQKTVSDLRLISRVLSRRVDTPKEEILSMLAFVYRCHRRILRAVRRGDGAAAAHWMRTHLRAGRDRFIRHMNQAERSDNELLSSPSMRRAIARIEHFDPQPRTDKP